jgi:hypothetical protein
MSVESEIIEDVSHFLKKNNVLKSLDSHFLAGEFKMK